MNRYVLFFISIWLYSNALLSQTRLSSLKESLFQASTKYKISFSYDDDFIEHHIGFTEALPDNRDVFFNRLLNDYEINVITSIGATYLLEPSSSSRKGEVICGKVISQLQNEAVSGILVILGKQYTTTDKNGSFTFYPKVNYPEHLEFINEKNETKKEFILNPRDCDFYYLDEGEIQLGEVIVNYTAPLVKKDSRGVFELSPNTIPTAAGLIDPDVFFIIQRLPGITSPTADASIFIRGGVPDQNLVLWNGIRLYHTSHAYGSLMSINPYGIDKVYLLTKGISSKFGEHTAGALLLNNEARFNDQTRLSFGSNSIDSDFEADMRISSSSRVQLSGRKSFNSSLSNSFKNHSFNRLFGGDFENTPNNQMLSYQDYQAVYHKKISPVWSLQQNMFYSSDQSSYQLNGSDAELRDQVDSKNLGVGLKVFANSPESTLAITSQYSRYDANFNRDEVEYEITTKDDEDDEIEIEFSELDTRGNQVVDKQLSIYHSKFNSNEKIIFGGEWISRDISFNSQTITNDELKIEQGNQTSTSLFAAFSEYSIDRKLYSFDLGIRTIWFDFINKFRFEPRFNGTLKFSENTRLNVNYERKSQSVYKTTETLSSSIDRYTNLWVGTDGDLYPLLQSNQLGLGFSHSKNRFTVDMDFYMKNMEGLTTFNFGYLDPNDQDFHVGSAAIRGIDFFIQKQFNKAIFWLSYSFQDNLNTFEGLNENKAFPSNFLITHYLNTSSRVDLKGLSIELNSLYRSGIPYSEPTGYEVIGTAGRLTYNELNNLRTADFWRIDFSITKELKIDQKRRLSFKIAALNLLQRQNVVERFYRFNNQLKTIETLNRYDLQPKLKFGLRLSL